MKLLKGIGKAILTGILLMIIPVLLLCIGPLVTLIGAWIIIALPVVIVGIVIGIEVMKGDE